MKADSYVDKVMAKAQKKADRYFLMKQMAGEGRNYEEIGQAVGLSRERVRQILGSNRDVAARILAEKMNTICDMWVADDSLREIARTLDVPFRWICDLKFPRRVKPITHGGSGTGYRRGCRCDECKAANAKRTRERFQRLRRKETDMIEYLREGAAMKMEWISTKERLPEPHQDCLLARAGTSIVRCGYRREIAKGLRGGPWRANRCNWEEKFFTHWMPLPEPAKLKEQS